MKKTVMTINEVNNIKQLAELAAENGHVTILKDDRPKLLVIDLDEEPQIEMSEDEKFEFVTSRILREHKAAFEALAK